MKQLRNLSCLLSCFAGITLAACGGGAAAVSPANKPPRAAVVPIANDAALAVFQSRCMPCHGMSGHGDGPGAAACEPKPRSFADVAWQDSVTDEQIQKAIVYGGAAVGKSAIMPAQPDLKGNKATLAGLVNVVRAWRGK
ncbi:MAG: hypothetical protein JNN13_10935 [Planctomycetes bacterium]|nr:hypothetical protein [Planctomycetota bacterium]